MPALLTSLANSARHSSSSMFTVVSRAGCSWLASHTCTWPSRVTDAKRVATAGLHATSVTASCTPSVVYVMGRITPPVAALPEPPEAAALAPAMPAMFHRRMLQSEDAVRQACGR